MTRAHKWDLGTESVFANFTEVVSQMRLAGKRVIVEFVPEKRTLSQNALAFALYTQIAAQVEDQSINEIRAECKLTVGVGLLRASDEQFREFYDSALKCLTYEQTLAAMAYVPVTSIMDKAVFSKFADEVIRKYSQQGISLISPQEQAAYG